MSMGSLRGRTRDSGWQWLIIGMILGLGCSGVFCLGLYALNLVRFNIPGTGQEFAGAPTVPASVFVVTSTSEPTIPTLAPTTAPTQALASATPLVQAPAAGGQASATPFVAAITPIGSTPTLNATVIAPPATTAVPASTAAATSAGTTNPATPVGAAAVGAPAAGSTGPVVTPSDLVPIQGGIFEMGTTIKEAQTAVDDCVVRDKGRCDLSMVEDSYPAHNVTVNSFRIEKYEVSYEQFIAFLNFMGPKSHSNGCGGQPCAAMNGPEAQGSYFKFDGTKYLISSELYLRRPAAYVTWYGADSYCKSVGRRLPTEAEWERAARDGDKRLYPWGNDWDSNAPKARTSRPKNEGGPDFFDAYPTGRSADQVFNLAGNVSEWVFDWYDAAYYKTTATSNPIDPRGPASSPKGTKVARGGDWDAPPLFARAVHRQDFDPARGTGRIGFRCAADQELSSSAAVPPKAGPTTNIIVPTVAGAQPLNRTQPVNVPTATFTPGALPSGNKP